MKLLEQIAHISIEVQWGLTAQLMLVRIKLLRTIWDYKCQSKISLLTRPYDRRQLGIRADAPGSCRRDFGSVGILRRDGSLCN